MKYYFIRTELEKIKVNDKETEVVELTEDELRNMTNGLISNKIFTTCEKWTKKESDREWEI